MYNCNYNSSLLFRRIRSCDSLNLLSQYCAIYITVNVQLQFQKIFKTAQHVMLQCLYRQSVKCSLQIRTFRQSILTFYISVSAQLQFNTTWSEYVVCKWFYTNGKLGDKKATYFAKQSQDADPLYAF
jgi:hypothetical protein